MGKAPLVEGVPARARAQGLIVASRFLILCVHELDHFERRSSAAVRREFAVSGVVSAVGRPADQRNGLLWTFAC
jgi:hypothetical protein